MIGDSETSAIAGVKESNRHAADAGTRRLAAFLMVLFALLLGVLTWFSNEVNTTHASSNATQAVEIEASHEVPQFKPTRVNQAGEPDEHIQAF